VRGCSLYRGRILSCGARGVTPAEALELARHLSACAGCARERTRIEALDRELARLEQVEVPGSFARRVMDGLRRAAPTAAKAGACVAVAILVSAILAGGGLALQRGELLPRLQMESAETLGDAMAGLGRAVVVLLSCALKPGPSPLIPSASHALHAPHLAASGILIAGLVLLVLSVVLTHARARGHERR